MPSENGVATPLPCSTPEEMMTSYPLDLRLGAIHLSSFVCVAKLIGDIYERPWGTPVDPLGDARGDSQGKSVESVRGFPAPLGYPLGTTLRDSQGGSPDDPWGTPRDSLSPHPDPWSDHPRDAPR